MVVGVVALIVIGPKDLPDMFRTMGRFTAKARSMARDFQRAMEAAADEAGVKDVAKDLKNVTSARSMGLDAVKNAASKFEKWDPMKPAPKPAASAPVVTAPAPVVADAKPALMLTAARDGGADDLKLIGGVGPKLEQTLNELGIYHFDQVAKFKKKDIAWVDARLRFKGRIERDDWMSQAKVLAKGGETAFSKKKKT